MYIFEVLQTGILYEQSCLTSTVKEEKYKQNSI